MAEKTLEELREAMTKAGAAHFEAWVRFEEARAQLIQTTRTYYDAKAEAGKAEEK